MMQQERGSLSLTLRETDRRSDREQKRESEGDSERESNSERESERDSERQRERGTDLTPGDFLLVRMFLLHPPVPAVSSHTR